MKKKLDEYEPGDVIRGTFYIKNVPKKHREHTLIIINVSQQMQRGASHISCVPACSFSSKVPKGDKSPCLDLSNYSIPDDFFDSIKPVTVLRFSEPQCLKAFEVKEFRGNLGDYDNLWGDICNLMNREFPHHVSLMQQVCDCDCLEEQNIQVGYCHQDEQVFSFDNNAICSCCGSAMGDTAVYVECSECRNNEFVTIVDKNGQPIQVIYETV